MANQYTSRGGVSIQAHVVHEDEKELQVRVDGGNDRLGIGDALVTLQGKEYVLRAGLFAALFGPVAAVEAAPAAALPKDGDEPPPAPPKGGKGGQHEAAAAAKR